MLAGRRSGGAPKRLDKILSAGQVQEVMELPLGASLWVWMRRPVGGRIRKRLLQATCGMIQRFAEPWCTLLGMQHRHAFN